MTPLLGPRNPNVQHLRRLVGRRSARTGEGLFVIDGPVLVREAMAAGLELVEIFLDEGASPAVQDLAAELDHSGVVVHHLATGVLSSASDTVTPNGISAVARRAPATMADLTDLLTRTAAPLIVVLAGVADPGNAGTILRSADAAGAAAVIAGTGSVDLFSPKTVRASAGALFHLPVVPEAQPAEVAAALRTGGVRALGTVARSGTSYDDVDLRGPCALVLGNEAHGLDADWSAVVDDWVTIPMGGQAESLNVAMAATVLAFEAARQRRSAE